MKPKKSCLKKILGFSCIMLMCFMCVGCTSKKEKQEAMKQEMQLEKKMKQRIKDNANDQQAVLEHRESTAKDSHEPKIIMGESKQKGSSQSTSIIERAEEKESGNGIVDMTPSKESQDVIDIKPKKSNDTIDLKKKSTNNGVTITKEKNNDIEIKKKHESDVIIR